jgi:hypothetical protein
MWKVGLIAAAAAAFALSSGAGHAQNIPIGPEYQKAACACKVTARRDMKRWPDCMKRRGYTVPAGADAMVTCPQPAGKKK